MKAFFCVMVMVVVEIEMSFGDTHLNARQQKKKNNQMTTTTMTMMKNYYSEYIRYRYLK